MDISEVRDNKKVAYVKYKPQQKNIAQMLLYIYIYTLPYIFMAMISASRSQSSLAVTLVLVYGYTKQKQLVISYKPLIISISCLPPTPVQFQFK